MCQFQIYTGKPSQSAEKELGARVVKDLTRSLVGKGHHVYFDNYFNSRIQCKFSYNYEIMKFRYRKYYTKNNQYYSSI
nr:unnamed protein product [Callosobruchus chinensis]